jgi:LmbE family N-acetylglucosaminyl deacetylase
MTRNVRALCIVAHPDDEAIWMGGTILKNKNWDWTIVSLCRKDDSDREPKFKKVCDIYKADGIISDLDDERLSPLKIEKVVSKIKQVLPKGEYDYVFTHGKEGEYGHIRHREIHKAVKKMVAKGDLEAGKICYFAYKPGLVTAPHDLQTKIPVPDENADWVVSLSGKEFNKKYKIVKDVYGFQEGIFETLSCSKKEAFVLK